MSGCEPFTIARKNKQFIETIDLFLGAINNFRLMSKVYVCHNLKFHPALKEFKHKAIADRYVGNTHK